MNQLAVQDLHKHCIATQALLLDVREHWEVERAAIRLPGIRHKHIPLASLPERLDELDPSQSIVCICHHGVRSLQVVAFLERQGYESVYNLAGGIDAWASEIDPSVPRY
ncbi:MAG TPA: rhodanese-like domain-containing protein [Albitalea sp.]|nr:rhodanese-like domain-containing protein [Albitalea sp.]